MRNLGPPSQYPLQDRPLALPSGRVVQLYNVVAIAVADASSSFGVQYRSTISAGDEVNRREEAIEVIAKFAPLFSRPDVTSASAQLCGTRAQAERREPPEMIFQFERGDDSAWRYVATVRPSRSLGHE
jgi:hypothetical protein